MTCPFCWPCCWASAWTCCWGDPALAAPPGAGSSGQLHRRAGEGPAAAVAQHAGRTSWPGAQCWPWCCSRRSLRPGRPAAVVLRPGASRGSGPGGGDAARATRLLATKSLRVESMKVYRALKEGICPAARRAVVHDRGPGHPEPWTRQGWPGRRWRPWRRTPPTA